MCVCQSNFGVKTNPFFLNHYRYLFSLLKWLITSLICKNSNKSSLDLLNQYIADRFADNQYIGVGQNMSLSGNTSTITNNAWILSPNLCKKSKPINTPNLTCPTIWKEGRNCWKMSSQLSIMDCLQSTIKWWAIIVCTIEMLFDFLIAKKTCLKKKRRKLLFWHWVLCREKRFSILVNRYNIRLWPVFNVVINFLLKALNANDWKYSNDCFCNESPSQIGFAWNSIAAKDFVAVWWNWHSKAATLCWPFN